MGIAELGLRIGFSHAEVPVQKEELSRSELKRLDEELLRFLDVRVELWPEMIRVSRYGIVNREKAEPVMEYIGRGLKVINIPEILEDEYERVGVEFVPKSKFRKFIGK